MPNAAAKTQNSILVSHWSKLIESFATDSTAFYVSVERALGSRKIPELKTSSVEWKEGGLFSAKREYLRVEWKRYILDICAAPFGTGFFFSSWLSVRAAGYTLAHLLGTAATAAALVFIVMTQREPLAALLFAGIAMLLLLMVLRAGFIGTRGQVEEFLLGLTIIGPLDELFHRSVTYYEMDTEGMFQAASHAALMEAIDQATNAKGVRPLTDEERKPVMRDFFKK